MWQIKLKFPWNSETAMAGNPVLETNFFSQLSWD